MRLAYVCQPYPPMISGAALAAQRPAEGMSRPGHTASMMAASERRQDTTCLRALLRRTSGSTGRW